jgi:hypothetical protein
MSPEPKLATEWSQIKGMVALSPDGEMLADVDADENVAIHDAETEQLLRTIRVPYNRRTSLVLPMALLLVWIMAVVFVVRRSHARLGPRQP